MGLAVDGLVRRHHRHCSAVVQPVGADVVQVQLGDAEVDQAFELADVGLAIVVAVDPDLQAGELSVLGADLAVMVAVDLCQRVVAIARAAAVGQSGRGAERVFGR